MPKLKLTKEQVEAIRAEPDRKGLVRDLCDKYGIHKCTVHKIRRNIDYGSPFRERVRGLKIGDLITVTQFLRLQERLAMVDVPDRMQILCNQLQLMRENETNGDE